MSEMLSESQHAIKSSKKNGFLNHEESYNDGVRVFL